MEPILTGAAANLAAEAAKGIFQEMKSHIRYVIIYKKNVDKFEEKLKTLIAKRASVQQEVDAADRNGEKIKADVQHWSNTVDKVIIEEEKKVKDLEDKAKNKCFIGLCPNIKSRNQLSRKAEEGVATIDDLIQQCQFNGVGYRDVPEAILDASPKDFETFKSREKVFNDIMEATKNATINMIGLYGLAGMGKTSLVKEVARQVQELKLFDSVVTVIMTQTPDIQNIQDQIAELLGLRLEDKSTVVRARRLCERLKKEKKVLVVLDNVWKKLDLEEVGIPFGNQHKGCKILLTSRDQNVLSNGMDAEKTFSIGDLDDEEAWDLFRKMVGDSVESAELRSTAIEVAQRCARLPLAIATVARALRNKSLFAWEDALRQLQRPSSSNFTGISADVYSAIELSYNHLESDELKQTFLLCTLLRHDSSIDYLLQCAIGLGLINGVSTVKEARNRLLTLVSNLKASCLLLDNNLNDRYFGMHDLVYDVAVSIASKDNHVFALNGEVLEDWPNGETMNKIYLRYPSIIGELPSELNCPEVVLFIFFSEDLSLKMPPSFFNETKNLKVLDLSDMQFSSLPLSTCLLTSLRALFLNRCELRDITSIGELKNLEILNLSYSDIKILPKDIGRLVKLKLLDLSHCTKLKIISPGVLSSLSRLEELYMGGTFIQWEVGGHANQRGSIASLAELNTLSCLTTLEVHIPDAEAISRGLLFKELHKLIRYQIFIGKEWEWFGEYEHSRTLKLKLSTSIDHLDHGIKLLLKKTEALYLDDLKSVTIAMQEFKDEESLSHLKNLHIQNDSVIKYIIIDNGIVDKNEFLQLQSLTLQNLPQLISFCSEDENGSTSRVQDELPLFSEKSLFPCLENLRLSSISVERIWHDSFCNHENLTSLIIENCGNLKRLLSFSMSRKLVHLKCFEIIGCNLKNVFPASVARVLPQLRDLHINDCGVEEIVSKEEGLETTVTFRFDQVIPQLEKLSLNIDDINAMISDSQFSRSLFREIKVLRVCNSGDESVVFPITFLERFQNLEKLVVISYEFKELFCDERDSGMETYAGTLPTIRSLKLICLDNLKHLWKQDVQVDRILPNLETLQVHQCDELISLGSSSASFQNLLTLDVCSCGAMICLVTSLAVQSLAQLKKLRIRQCISMKEIVGNEGDEATYNINFSKLKSLELCDLPQITSFCSGNHTFGFPSLEEVIMNKCPEMEIFCKGVLNAPMLERVQVTDKDGKGHWGGDLNSTVQQLYAEKVGYKGVEYVVLSEFSKSTEIWKENPEGVFNFVNLTYLEVYKCKSLKYIFTVSMALDLLQLKEIKVRNCPMMEQIITREGAEEASIVLPRLQSITLRSCSNLRSFSLGSITMECPSLQCIDAVNCSKLLALASTFVGEKDTETVAAFFNDKYLQLSCLPNMASFCLGDHNLEFPILEKMIVRKCPKMKIFCQGDLSTPQLQKVILTEDGDEENGQWEGDLKTTIKRMFEEEASARSISHKVRSSLFLQLASTILQLLGSTTVIV
ncbi:hypothetical protein POUND7_000266 [Theobroma cacao]